MMTNFEMVKEFNKAFGVPSASVPVVISPERKLLRLALIAEEFKGKNELADSMHAKNLIGIADGLADLLYVVYGTAVEYGIDIDAVFAEVHRSNMSKLGENGNPILRQDGKVLKGPFFSPPDIKKCLDMQFLRD